ncbi:MAG: glutathione S-transferase family protein [Pseudomonadota bacterium]
MLKLHFAPNSRAGRIVWLLEELGLEYELNKMPFSMDALKSPEHRARHPLGRVPVLEDGDVTLYESGAIVEYVIARHTDGAMRPAPDHPTFPAYLQWFHYCEGMIMPPINTIVVHTIILPEERRDATVLGQARRLCGKALEPINRWLDGREYLADTFSGADIMLGHAMYMCRRQKLFTDDMTGLHAYVERIAARPAFDKAINMQA